MSAPPPPPATPDPDRPEAEPPEEDGPVAALAEAAAETGRTVMRASVRLYQRILGDLILVLAFLGLVYFLVYFTINSNYARRVFDELVNGQVFRGSIQWERISWGPWPSELHIQKPVLSDSTGHPVIRVDEVDVSLDLTALTEGAIVAEDIIIDSPVVDFHEVPIEDEWGNPTKALNIGAMFLPPQRVPDPGLPGGPPTMQFRVSEIRNARYRMDLPSIDVDCRGVWVEDAFFELKANPTGAGPVSMNMGAHSVQVRDVLVTIPKTESELPASKRPAAEVWRWRPKGVVLRDYTWKDWAFRAESFRARLGDDRLEVQAFALDLDPVRGVSLGGRLHMNLQDIGPHLAMFGVQGISGPVEVDMRTSGELMSQSGGGTLVGRTLSLPGGVKTGPWALNVRHENNRLDIQRLDVQAGGGRVTGHAFLDGERGRALAELLLDTVSPAKAGLTAPEGPAADALAGAYTGRLDAKVTDLWADIPVISATTDLRIVRPEDTPSPLPVRTQVEASAIWAGPALDVRHLRLETSTDRVTAAGTLDLDAQTARGDVDAEVGDLAVWGAVARLPLSGSATLSASVSGPWRRPEARLTLEAREVSWDRLPPVRLDVAAKLAGGRLEVSKLSAASGETQVELNGRADIFRPDGALSAEAHVEHLNLPDWARGQPVKGVARLDLSAGGTLSMPQWKGSLAVVGAAWPGTPEGDVAAQFEARGLQHPVLNLRGLDVTTAVGEVHASGTLHPLDLDADTQLEVGLKHVKLAGLPLHQPIGGELEAALRVEGPLRMPAVGGHIEVEAPRYGSLTLDHLTVDAAWRPPYVKVESLRLRGTPAAGAKARDYVTASGLSLKLPELAFEGEVALDQIPLALVNHFVAEPLPLQGTLSAHLVGRGTPQDPAANGELVLDDAAWEDIDIGDARMTVEAGDQRVRADATLFEETQIAVSVPTSPGQGPATFTIRFTDLSPEAHVKRLADANLRTRLTGTISGGADLFAPPDYQPFADVEITDLRATYNRLDLVNIEPIRASYRDRDLTLSRLGLQAAGQKIRAEGTLRQHQTLDAHVDGDLDLGLLQGLLSGTFSVVQGQATLGLIVTGPLTNPAAEGRIKLSRAFLVPRSGVVGNELELMEPVELWVQSSMAPAMGPDPAEQRGNYVITLPRMVPATTRAGAGGAAAPMRPNRLVLRRDEGRLTVSALDVALAQFLPDSLSLRLDADNVSLLVPDTVRATFDADDLVFSMSDMLKPTRTELFLGGKIYLQRATYTADIMPSGDINQGLSNNLRGVSQARTVSAFERYPVLQRFKVDLRVDGDNDVFVRNSVSVVSLDLEIRPSLRIRGNLYNRTDLQESEQLRIEGEVSTLPDTSHIVYSGREFEVSSAQVDFGKGNFLDATLVARRNFDSCGENTAGSAGTSGPSTNLGNGQKQETVTLELRYRLATLDTPGEPSLQLSSDSGASAIDVATLVLTGACPSQLTAASSAQPALEAAFTPVLNLIEAPLKQTLDIDLNLTPSGQGALIVEADKALSKRLRLYSYAPVGSAEDATIRRQFGLEYQINNFAFGDLSNQSLGQENNTTGQLILMLNLD